MDDKKLTKLSLILSLVGLILIYYITTVIEVKAFAISDIDKSMIDRDVKVSGEIANVIKTDKVLILLVKDESSSISVVSFDPEEIPKIKEGQFIEVTGKVALYKNKLEIIADSINTND